MSFMQPQIELASYWEVETNHGTEVIPCDVCDDANALGNYLEDSTIHSSERVSDGFLCRLSAPGYLDCTDWAACESVVDCVRELAGSYGDGFDLEDWKYLGSCLDWFDEFWAGYLLALAFTAHRDDEPLFHNPGGDISDVVDLDSFESDLREKCDLTELLTDCVLFYCDALPLVGDQHERAGSDFHFTRNGHGVGFWDGDWPENGDQLNALAKPYGTAELEVVDDCYYIHN